MILVPYSVLSAKVVFIFLYQIHASIMAREDLPPPEGPLSPPSAAEGVCPPTPRPRGRTRRDRPAPRRARSCPPESCRRASETSGVGLRRRELATLRTRTTRTYIATLHPHIPL